MDYRQQLKNHKRVIVKVGTTSLTYPNGALNLQQIEKFAWVLTDLHNQGKEVILVSSGAIAVGTDRLKLQQRPHDIKGKQAASAVGQAALMQIYESFFMKYNQIVAQVLLTKDVIDNAHKRQNARNTLFELLKMGVIPIINANDTISIDELDFSDNDTLSAYVACLIEGDALIILSDINGLYNADPKINSNATLLNKVEKITTNIKELASGSSSNLGTGGMATKVKAAEMATCKGIDTVIASGNDPSILFQILKGNDVGTLFCKE